jgi:uncharacterized damage-inducible protein DinB
MVDPLERGDPLDVFLRQHRWATLRMLDACAAAGDAVLDATATGTYGTIRDTLVHLVAADGRFARLLDGHPPRHPVRERAGFSGFAALREEYCEAADALVAHVAHAAALAPDKLLRGTWVDGTAYAIPVLAMVHQALHHGAEHRQQLAVLLTQCSVEPPALDPMTFWREELGVQDGWTPEPDCAPEEV